MEPFPRKGKLEGTKILRKLKIEMWKAQREWWEQGHIRTQSQFSNI